MLQNGSAQLDVRAITDLDMFRKDPKIGVTRGSFKTTRCINVQHGPIRYAADLDFRKSLAYGVITNEELAIFAMGFNAMPVTDVNDMGK
jgi:hypothetical protein